LAKLVFSEKKRFDVVFLIKKYKNIGIKGDLEKIGTIILHFFDTKIYLIP